MSIKRLSDSSVKAKNVGGAGPRMDGRWAVLSGGTVTTYTKPDGSVMEVHTFTANGSLTVQSPGYADVLLVSGGSGVSTGAVADHGGGADILDGLRAFSAGTHAVIVGAAGPISSDVHAATGAPSSIGAVSTGRGRIAAWADRTTVNTAPAKGAPHSSTISGTAQNFGAAGGWAAANGSTVAGDGGQYIAGLASAGIVIVAVRI